MVVAKSSATLMIAKPAADATMRPSLRWSAAGTVGATILVEEAIRASSQEGRPRLMAKTSASMLAALMSLSWKRARPPSRTSSRPTARAPMIAAAKPATEPKDRAASMIGSGEMKPIARASEVFCTVSIDSSAEASPPPMAARMTTLDILAKIGRMWSAVPRRWRLEASRGTVPRRPQHEEDAPAEAGAGIEARGSRSDGTIA